MPDLALHPADLPPEILLTQCEVKFVRRSGPGGQHRNKVSTGVVIVHRPTGISAEASERRSQAENRAVAMFRLRVRLALEVRIVRDAAEVPSPLWRSRVHGGRIAINVGHDDFPALLAEAMDFIAAHGFDPKPAAETLACTVSQLIKLLGKEPEALKRINSERMWQGRHPLQ